MSDKSVAVFGMTSHALSAEHKPSASMKLALLLIFLYALLGVDAATV